MAGQVKATAEHAFFTAVTYLYIFCFEVCVCAELALSMLANTLSVWNGSTSVPKGGAMPYV